MAYIGSAPTTTASRKSQVTYRYLLTAGQSVISGADLNNNTLSCDPLDTEIFMNGLKLDSTDTTITATQVSLATPGAAGDEIDVVAYRTFESADHYTKSTADARYEPIDSAYTKAEADTRYVNVTGDTMSGDLGIGGIATDASWSTQTYGNREVAIDGGGGYGVLHLRGDGAGSTNTRFSMGVGDGNFYMAYDDVATTHRIQVNSSGAVTMPSNPAFRAYTSSNANYTSLTTVVYDSVLYNRGNHYNASNGFFTAPVAGVYQFGTYHWHNTNTGGQSKLQMFKNGTMVFEFVESRSTSMAFYTRVGFHHEILLAANDVVKVMAGGVSGGELHLSNGVGYSYFAGHLIG